MSSSCLNRTFYGIETSDDFAAWYKENKVLIVPFMELKQVPKLTTLFSEPVLIVPFMELKQDAWTLAASSERS